VDSLTTAFHLDPAVRTLSNELKIDQTFITEILLKQGLDKDTMVRAGRRTPRLREHLHYANHDSLPARA